MTELIADLPYRVIDVGGNEYYASVAAEQRPDGMWEAWLEYVPLEESDALLTDTETTQSTREDLVRWAETLTETYVQGAFPRAVAATTGSRLIAQRSDVGLDPELTTSAVRSGLEDPFELYSLVGISEMRAHLLARPRSTLLAIIDAFGLNPARKSLSWLTQSQLATFIVTATEVQLASGKRSG